ncbi:MAG: nucleoside recognition domain-containing protein [Bacteroidales bacterium]|nr:nucleoside recognition domain-containing protein [Bacteroidales bacterium]
MVLNYIWIAFFIIAFIVALFRLIFLGDIGVFPDIVNSTFEMSKTGFELSLGLTGVMTLWLGIMKIGEKGGMVAILSRLVGPLFAKLFPEVPRNHPVSGSILMNLAANMLGLDNAATPLGLKAMTQLQELNQDKEKASNAMIMFMTLNTSGLTLIPISIIVYRVQLGAANPADIFIPILISTFISTLVGILAVSAYQRINLLNRVVLLYLGGLSLLISTIIWFFSNMAQTQLNDVSSLISTLFLFTIIISFILLAARKKVNVYEAFIEGAQEGFGVAIKIIPYLVAILVGVGVFRAAGVMDALVNGIGACLEWMSVDTSFVPALPTAFMKPFSGSGARGLMIETMTHYGVDSFAGRLSCTLQGATDTTFYIIALYFGSVGIRKTRHAISCGLLADAAGAITAIVIAYLFFA